MPSREHISNPAIAYLVGRIADHTVSVAAALPPVSEDLDTDQRAAVTASESTLRILAPAGAGKTHCMVNKVLSSLKSGSNCEQILLVTFDKNAKGEMKARLDLLLNHRGVPGVFTLNAFGYKLLQRFGPGGNRRGLISASRAGALIGKIVGAARSTQAAREVLPDGVAPRFYLELISLFKNRLCYADPDKRDEVANQVAYAIADLRDESKDVLFAKIETDNPRTTALRAARLVDVISDTFIQYEEAKRRTGEIDFDDQKLDAYRLLLEDDNARSAVQGNYRLVIVDEFQDLNELDFRLILCIAEKASLVVVGDDDQAIYGFRDTSPKYILEFEQRSGRPTRTIVLRKNYRCPANVVMHAAALISNNRERVDKDPIAARSETCEIRVYNPPDVQGEAAAIVTWIERVIDRKRAETLRDVAVIYRFNAQSVPIQLELIAHDMPYYCRTQDNLSSQKVLLRLLGVLRYMRAVRTGLSPDVTDFVTTVSAFYPRLSDVDQQHLAHAAGRVRPPYIDALNERGSPRVPNAQDFRGLVEQIAQITDPQQVVELVATEFRGIQGMVGGLDDAMDGNLPLGELARIAGRYTSVEDFTEFLDTAVTRAATLGSDRFDSPRIRLITYFRSKGLQFGTVILPTLNERQIPHWRAPEEEERRLFYVGVTRATSNLWLSYVDEVCGHPAKPSKFLKELKLPAAAFITAPDARTRAPDLIAGSNVTTPLRDVGGSHPGWAALESEKTSRQYAQPADTLRMVAERPEDDFLTRYLDSLRTHQPLDSGSPW